MVTQSLRKRRKSLKWKRTSPEEFPRTKTSWLKLNGTSRFSSRQPPCWCSPTTKRPLSSLPWLISKLQEWISSRLLNWQINQQDCIKLMKTTSSSEPREARSSTGWSTKPSARKFTMPIQSLLRVSLRFSNWRPEALYSEERLKMMMRNHPSNSLQLLLRGPKSSDCGSWAWIPKWLSHISRSRPPLPMVSNFWLSLQRLRSLLPMRRSLSSTISLTRTAKPSKRESRKKRKSITPRWKSSSLKWTKTKFGSWTEKTYWNTSKSCTLTWAKITST